MGVITDAILFYGYCWENEKRILPGGRDNCDWTQIIMKRRGVPNPWDSLPDTKGMDPMEEERITDEWIRDHRSEIDSYRNAKDSVREEFRVHVGEHCSDDCPSPFLAARDSVVRAGRGYPKEIRDLNVPEIWDADLARFLNEFDISPPRDRPRWWLVSYWG